MIEIGKPVNAWALFYGGLVPNWLMKRKELSPGAKICFARLVQFCGRYKYLCFPAQETLGEELGISTQQAKRYIKELKTVKLIDVKQRGFNQSNVYYILGHKWMEGETIEEIKNLKDLPDKQEVS